MRACARRVGIGVADPARKFWAPGRAAECTAAKDLTEVIEARVRRWHDKVVPKPGRAPRVARTDLFHSILYWAGGLATVLVVLLLLISVVAASRMVARDADLLRRDPPYAQFFIPT